MKTFRPLFVLFVATGLFAACGANCQNLTRQPTPVVRKLPPAPTLDQVIQVVNANNGSIHSLRSDQAKISGTNFMALKASLAFQSPKYVRIQGSLTLSGPELDVGSNETLFWFWVRRSNPPAVYFCRHDQFAAGAVRQNIPIQPDWLIEALGAATFDPTLSHQGPFHLPNDRIEVKTVKNSPAGPVTKSTILDGASGCVVEQHYYDATGNRLASSVVKKQRIDPLSGLTVPQIVDIDCPSAPFNMEIDLGAVEVNRAMAPNPQLWAMPSYPDAPPVDLAQMAGGVGVTSVPCIPASTTLAPATTSPSSPAATAPSLSTAPSAASPQPTNAATPSATLLAPPPSTSPGAATPSRYGTPSSSGGTSSGSGNFGPQSYTPQRGASSSNRSSLPGGGVAVNESSNQLAPLRPIPQNSGVIPASYSAPMMPTAPTALSIAPYAAKPAPLGFNPMHMGDSDDEDDGYDEDEEE